MTITTTHKNRDIEVLRAVAILFTLFLHWVPHALTRLGRFWDGFPNYTSLWSGVDLFFCISGFVITSSLLREVDEARYSLTFSAFAIPFWIRRIWRLWPSAWLWLVVPLLLAYFFNEGGSFGVPRAAATDALMAALNIYNLHRFFCEQSQSCGSLSIYWSLSLEEQFYFIFPFLFFFLARRTLALVLAVLALTQFFFPRSMIIGPNLPSLLWLTRSDAICFGALIALWSTHVSYARCRPTFLASKPIAIAITVPLLFTLTIIAAPQLGLKQATGIIALISAVLVWIASYCDYYIFPRVPILEPILLWLGSRSYSLYLVHLTIGRIPTELRARFPDSFNGPAGVAISMSMVMILTFAVSELNYRWIEVPLRRKGRHLALSEASQSPGPELNRT